MSLFDSSNRRSFLKTTSTVAAITAASQAIRPLHAADRANRKLRVAVMGTNGRGIAHINGFLSVPDVEIGAVCDVDSRAIAKGVQAALKNQSAEPRGMTDIRRALEDPDIDILSIAAPNHWHAPATIMACNAGKHVYVEKPGSHNPWEAFAMVKAAENNNRVVQLGTQRRSWPWVIEAIEKLHAGEIGKLTYAETWYNNARPSIGTGKPAAVPDWLNYDLWQGPAPRRPFKDNLIHYNWHWHWHWGNGELGNNGIHALDVARWGLQVDYPQYVACGGGRYHFNDDQETPDIYQTTFDFEHCGISWNSHSHHPRGIEGAQFGIKFFGDQGQLVIAGNSYTVYDPNGKELAKVEGRWNDQDHFTNFVNAIRDGEQLTQPISEGQKSTLLCHLGNIAWRTRKTIQFDPKDIDSQASLWKRDYEPGWEPKA